MKYNFKTQQVEIDNNELLLILEERLQSRYISLNDDGFNLYHKVQPDGFTIKLEATDKKASERDIKVFQAMQTLKKELNIDKLVRPFDLEPIVIK